MDPGCSTTQRLPTVCSGDPECAGGGGADEAGAKRPRPRAFKSCRTVSVQEKMSDASGKVVEVAVMRTIAFLIFLFRNLVLVHPGNVRELSLKIGLWIYTRDLKGGVVSI